MRALLAVIAVLIALSGCLSPAVDCGNSCFSDAGRLDGGVQPDGGSGVDCRALDAAACRAQHACIADFCTTCSCTPTFFGCRKSSEPGPRCPQLGCAQPRCCTADSQCTPQVCKPSGESTCLGVCDPSAPTCVNDIDCGGSAICEPRPCACGAQKSCKPGCGPTQPCATGLTCDAASRRCTLTRCTAAGDCASTFTCMAGSCQRKTCTDDSSCGSGFCVNQHCFDGYGTCNALSP